jgi:hypothetical protein
MIGPEAGARGRFRAFAAFFINRACDPSQPQHWETFFRGCENILWRKA